MVKSEWNANDDSAAARCCLFRDCAPDEVKAFLQASDVTVCEFAGGETIPPALREHCWGIVLRGSVRIFSDGEGGAALLNVVGDSEPFDIAALTGRRTAFPPVSAIAAGRCRAAFVKACDVRTLMRDYPTVAANCLAFMTGRIAFLNRKIHTLSCGSAEGKLADFLLSEFQCEDDSLVVRVKSCVELAGRLNISRASLYRALGALEERGAIARSGKHIVILDAEALA